ncbi:carbohydrate porin [Shewanella sp. 1180_01]|uniref:carbohydrate porin n=1 Tax=Shewanella sp. 1180_01 TaxID=2604451 RepID=UPI0040649D3A
MQKKYKHLVPMLFTLFNLCYLTTSMSVEASEKNDVKSVTTNLNDIKSELHKNYGVYFGGIVSSVYQQSSEKMYRKIPQNTDFSDEGFNTQFVAYGGWNFYNGNEFKASINGEYYGYLSGDTFSLTDPLSNTITDTWTNQLKQLYFSFDYGNSSLKLGRIDPTIEVVGWSGGHQFFNFLSFQLSGSTWLKPPYPGLGMSYTYNFTDDKLNYIRVIATDSSGHFNNGTGYKNLYKGDLWKALEVGFSNKRSGEGSASVKFTLFNIDRDYYFNDEKLPHQTEVSSKGFGIQGDYEIANGIKSFVRIGIAKKSRADLAVTAGILSPAHIFNRSQDTIGLGYSYSKPSNIFKSVNESNEQLLEGFYKYSLSKNNHLSLILSYIKNPIFTNGGTPKSYPVKLERNKIDSNMITSVRYTLTF